MCLGVCGERGDIDMRDATRSNGLSVLTGVVNILGVRLPGVLEELGLGELGTPLAWAGSSPNTMRPAIRLSLDSPTRTQRHIRISLFGCYLSLSLCLSERVGQDWERDRKKTNQQCCGLV